MKVKKILILSSLVLLSGMALIIGNQGVSSAADTVLSCTTYSTGSTGYATSMGLAEAVEKNEGIKIRVVPAGTDFSKVRPLKEGKMDLSLFTGAGQYVAMTGKGEFSAEGWGPQPLRLIYACPTGSIAGMMVRGDSGIKELSDLEGKTVAMIPGSPACKDLHEGYLAFAGLDLDDVKIKEVSSWGAAWSAVIDGDVDTAHCLVNSSKAEELAASPHGIHWLPAPEENKEGWERLNEFCPYLRPYKATQGAGATSDNPAQVASYYYGLVAYPDLDEELAYKVTKGIWNGYEIYSGMHPSLERWTQEGALETEGFLSPYHPGSVKFFKDEGVWTSTHEEKQNELLKKEEERIQNWEK